MKLEIARISGAFDAARIRREVELREKAQRAVTFRPRVLPDQDYIDARNHFEAHNFALADEICADDCHFRKLDATDRSAYQSVLKEFDDKSGGRLDVLHNNAGIIMLVVSLAGSIPTCGVAYIVMQVIGLIEGIIYLTKTPEEFRETYIDQQKAWF